MKTPDDRRKELRWLTNNPIPAADGGQPKRPKEPAHTEITPPDACPTETAGLSGDHPSLVRWLDEIDRPNGLGSRGPRSGSPLPDQWLPDNAARYARQIHDGTSSSVRGAVFKPLPAMPSSARQLCAMHPERLSAVGYYYRNASRHAEGSGWRSRRS